MALWREQEDDDMQVYTQSGAYSYGNSSPSHAAHEISDYSAQSGVAPSPFQTQQERQDEEGSEQKLTRTIGRKEPPPCCFCSPFIGRRPATCLLLGVTILTVIISVGLSSVPLQLESNFDSFLITDVESSMKLAAFDSAASSRSTGSMRRLQASGAPAFTTKDLYLAYELTSPGGSTGILSTKTLGQIARFEQQLREYPGFAEFCNQTYELYRGLCNPGLSFSSYVLPSLEIVQGSIVPQSMTLDGLGFDPVPLRTAFLVAEQHGLENLFLPTGYDPNIDENSQLLRTAFRFKFQVGTVADPVAERIKQKKEVDRQWEDFFYSIIIPLTTDEERMRTMRETMNVWVDGTGFKDFEVKLAVSSDIPLAVGSAIFILVYMLIHTRSVILAVTGPVLAVLSVPLSFIACGVFFQTRTVSFANFLAVFLAIGFGADVIFVYTDHWEMSSKQFDVMEDRLAWTYSRAVRASLATTSTTALSFLCNLASVIRALRQFGFFMGICVMLTWLTITFVYVPILLIDEKIWAKWREKFPEVSLQAHQLMDCRHKIAEFWIYFILKCRWPIVLLTIAFTGMCAALVVTDVQMGEGLPDIFPENHNQNRGRVVLSEFDSTSKVLSSTFTEPPREEFVCKEDDFERNPSSCVMQWCEAVIVEEKPPWGGNGTCSCKRRQKACVDNTAALAPVTVRFVGMSRLGSTQLAAAVGNHLLKGPEAVGLRFGDTATRAKLMNSQDILPQLLQQVWETGDTTLDHMMEVKVNLERDTNSTGASCGFDEICFCSGFLQCKLDKCDDDGACWTPARGQTYSLDIPGYGDDRRLESSQIQSLEEQVDVEGCGLGECHPLAGRALQQLISSKVKISQRMKVRAIFGVVPETSVKVLGERLPEEMWSFKENFDLSDPWAQRAMYFFCKDLPKELQVTRLWCWFLDFRKFSRQNSGRFPVKAVDWDASSKLFVDTSTSATRGTRYIWLEEGAIRGLYYSFEVGMKKTEDSEKVLAIKEKWDRYMKEWNDGAPGICTGAFHVSDVWVRVESNARLLASTATSLAILCVLAFVCMLIFTRSVSLSGIVVVCTVLVIVVLAFFITSVMRWSVGLIEVVAFIYFIGYALDYSLHIVYKYSKTDDARSDTYSTEFPGGGGICCCGGKGDYGDKTRKRFNRTAFALKVMGGATLGSAITTAGSSIFLVFCTLTIFGKLGAMCFIVTTASIAFALCPLLALLVISGPLNPGRCGSVDISGTRRDSSFGYLAGRAGTNSRE